MKFPKPSWLNLPECKSTLLYFWNSTCVLAYNFLIICHQISIVVVFLKMMKTPTPFRILVECLAFWYNHRDVILKYSTHVAFLHWDNTVRRTCEYCVFHITNAVKVFQITSRRRVICKAFFGMSDVENSIVTFPTSQYSHCWKVQQDN